MALLALVGCSSSSSTPPSNSSAPPVSQPAQSQSAPAASQSAGGKAIKIGILLPDLTISTLSDTYSGAKQEAAHFGNVTVVESGSTDTTTFVNDCQQLVSSGVQAIAYDTFDAPGTAACVSAANKAGVKVVCLYSCSPGKNDATIAFKFSVGGQLIGEWMAKQLNAEQKYQVAMLEGPAGDTVAPVMENEFKKVLAAGCPKCKIVTIARSAEDRNSGYQASLQLLAAHPDVNAIYAFQDDMGLGVQQAVQQQGLAGKVLVASFNGSCNAIASVLNKQMGLTILFAGQPYGAAAVDAAVALVRGQPVAPNKTILVPIDYNLAKGIQNKTVTETPTYKLVDLDGRVQSASAGCK
jgi:ribose transport system substrate-binding protein